MRRSKKKKIPVLKRAMANKGQQSWKPGTVSHASSSEERWTKTATKKKSQWREITRSVEEMGNLNKERKKRNVEQEVQRKREKRRGDFKNLEDMKEQVKKDDESRFAVVKQHRRLKKLKEEEDEARRQLEEVLDQRKAQEEIFWCELEDYMKSCEASKRETEVLATKIWQMTQSSDTKTQNLEVDFEELMSKAKELGWQTASESSKFWEERQDEHK